MEDFNYWDSLHRNEALEEFSCSRVGLLWLKLKSIIRVELVKGFLDFTGYEISLKKQSDNFRLLFDLLSKNIDKSHELLDEYIKCISNRQIANIDIQKLVSELYKLKNFEWGGDYQNSLDKYLVSRYVKVQNPSFDHLISKFETEINPAVQGYVLNSWYNYWSSILIENIFKSHPEVLPTVGQIKSVDFFIGDIPFDLKVTYLPAEYIKQKRKEKGLPVELTFLKQKAKVANVMYDKCAKPNDIFYEITEKMSDRNDDFCRQTLQTLKDEKIQILKEAQENPKLLAKWLYENQGEMRFGSENRLFLVLVDTDDFNNSWKLKRNIDLLKPTIVEYLDNFKNKKIEDLQVTFEFKGKPHMFSALADVIFVIK
ncbi:hypothetical protein [Bacteroides sp. 224]|uniref:hypothetical protein n=1 Tax=Bacteroides sp. 224 TaxID=2302936 RepID=UPI0013D0465C|nr:hypothetical protein [Bacteroides sp. 224]NDV65664.1 hypothetical protein [Bacteroides sp. 224]